MLHMSYWYGFARNMLSCITKSVMILLYNLPRLCLGRHCWLLVAATSYCPLLPLLPTTKHNTAQQNTSHIYTNTTQTRNITYQILRGSLIYVMKLYIQSPMWLNIEYRLHVLFPAIDESMTSSNRPLYCPGKYLRRRK